MVGPFRQLSFSLAQSMNENEFKPIAREILRQLGFQVCDLKPREKALTPDFEVTGKSSKYTVELKIKDDDPEQIANESKALSLGEVVGKSIPIGPRNRLAGVIRTGVKQMLDHDPHGESFRVIWLHSAGQDPELHNQRFSATLFGKEKLFSLKLPNIITCFYFHESAFFSWKDYLDGAMLTYRNTAQLCINTLSPRVDDFRKCELVQTMSKRLCDPDILHGLHNDVMIADCPIDRKQSRLVIKYLMEKYGIDHLQTIPMQKHTGKVLLNRDNEG